MAYVSTVRVLTLCWLVHSSFAFHPLFRYSSRTTKNYYSAWMKTRLINAETYPFLYPYPKSVKLVSRTRTIEHQKILHANRNNISDEATIQFITAVQSSLENNTFLSFSLQGPKIKKEKKRKKEKKNLEYDFDNDESLMEMEMEQVQIEKEKMRGCIKSVTGRLISLSNKKRNGNKNRHENSDQVILQGTIKFHGATDVAKNWAFHQHPQSSNDPSEVMMNLEELISGRFLASISDKESGAGNLDYFNENNDESDESNEYGIQSGELMTMMGTHILQREKKTSSFSYSFKKSKPLKKKANEGETSSNVMMKLVSSHDNKKKVPLSSDAKFLQKLGVSTNDGNPRPGMASKLRQCQRFVEIVGSLVEKNLDMSYFETITNEDGTKSPNSLKTVDMGCGRGYLTFSLHSFLSNKYSLNGIRVESVGIDIRPKLVREINAIANDLGDEFDSLNFVQGAIERFLPQHPDEVKKESNVDFVNENGNEYNAIGAPGSEIDVLIALHACDTATDDSLWFGISQNSKIIVTAPCCHKQVRKQLDPFIAKQKLNHPFYDVLRHGIYRERVAESVTDSIRALLLEIAGYDVQVFEFIGGEHTSKNVMITAVKKKIPSKAKLKKLRDRLHSLASMHGIFKQKLGDWMGETMQPAEDCASSKNGVQVNHMDIPLLPITRRQKHAS